MKTNSVRFCVKALCRSSSRAHQKWWESPNTSWTQGVGPSTRAEQSLSRRKSARATAQANMEPHRRNHPARARPYNNSGTPRTFAAANPRRQEAVSSENQPNEPCLRRQPTLGNASLFDVLQPGGTHHSQRHCVALLCPPLSRGRPGRVDCQPWKRGSPSTTTSSLLVSNWFTTPRSISFFPFFLHWKCRIQNQSTRKR